MVNISEVAEHVVDSHNGIYSAQVFAERYGDCIQGISKEELEILKAGPDYKEYIDVWGEKLSNADVIVDDKPFRVYENEGIYLIPADVEIDFSEWE